MKYNPEIHKRRSIRLKGYDYSQAGLYFITICVQSRERLFGKIENNEMILNDAGKMVYTEWEKLNARFSNIELHEFVVMPNHFHGILEIVVPVVGVSLVDTQIASSNEDGQPQGIAPTTRKTIVDIQNASNNENGQPQGIAPTASSNEDGQPQGIAPTVSSNENGQLLGIAPTVGKTVGDMMDAFKSITTVEYIRGIKKSGWQPFNGKLWQRNYYEHIIRNLQAYENISNYILNNPARWPEDKFTEG